MKSASWRWWWFSRSSSSSFMPLAFLILPPSPCLHLSSKLELLAVTFRRRLLISLFVPLSSLSYSSFRASLLLFAASTLISSFSGYLFFLLFFLFFFFVSFCIPGHDSPWNNDIFVRFITYDDTISYFWIIKRRKYLCFKYCSQEKKPPTYIICLPDQNENGISIKLSSFLAPHISTLLVHAIFYYCPINKVCFLLASVVAQSIVWRHVWVSVYLSACIPFLRNLVQYSTLFIYLHPFRSPKINLIVIWGKINSKGKKGEREK